MVLNNQSIDSIYGNLPYQGLPFPFDKFFTFYYEPLLILAFFFTSVRGSLNYWVVFYCSLAWLISSFSVIFIQLTLCNYSIVTIAAFDFTFTTMATITTITQVNPLIRPIFKEFIISYEDYFFCYYRGRDEFDVELV